MNLAADVKPKVQGRGSTAYPPTPVAPHQPFHAVAADIRIDEPMAPQYPVRRLPTMPWSSKIDCFRRGRADQGPDG